MLWAIPLAAAGFFLLSGLSRVVVPKIAPALMATINDDDASALHTSLVASVFR